MAGRASDIPAQGAGTARLTLSGTASEVTAALDALVYRADAGFKGTDAILVTATDSGSGAVVRASVDLDVRDIAPEPETVAPEPETVAPVAPTPDVSPE